MERNFKITMHVPLGRRSGKLCLREEKGTLGGTLEVLGSKGDFTGTLTADGLLDFTGKMTSLLRSFFYRATGRITGHSLELAVKGDRYSFRITGEEMDVGNTEAMS